MAISTAFQFRFLFSFSRQTHSHRVIAFATINRNVLPTVVGCTNFERNLNTGAINDDNDDNRSYDKFELNGWYFAGVIGVAVLYYSFKSSGGRLTEIQRKHSCVRTDLPTFKMSEISKHNTE